ncbi:MAG: hypothetical protein ACI4HZ_05710 [Ruminococcus sp.]
MIKFTSGISKALAVIFGFFTCVTIFCAFQLYTSTGHYFTATTHNNLQLFLLYSMNISGGILIDFGILAMFRLINKLSKRGLVIASAVLFALFGGVLLFVLLNYTTIPISDSFYVNDYAVGMAKGEYSVIDGSTRYFAKYSNNNPMVILLFFLYSVADFFGVNDLIAFGRCVNAVAIMGAQVMFFFAIKKLTGKLTSAVKFLLLSLIYPPVMFLVPWVYTASFCLPFMGGIFLAGANLYRTKKKSSIIINSAVAGFLTVAGYNIRPVVMILSIAFFICLVMWTLRSKERLKKSLTIALVGVIFAGGTFACFSAVNNHYYTGSERNFPLIHWVAMGLTNDGTFDGTLVAQNEKLSTKQEIKENCNKYIEKALKKYTPATFLNHLYLKHKSIWGDGSMSFHQRIKGVEKYAKGAKYIIGEKSDFLYIYCQMFWIALNILTLIFAVGFIINKQKKFTLAIFLTMLGAYGFYMLWEVKPSYATPFIFLVTAMAVLGGESIENVFAFATKKVKNTGRIAYGAVAVFSIVLMFIANPFFTEKVESVKTSVLEVTSTHNKYIHATAKRQKTISQEFCTDTKFNRITVLYKYKNGAIPKGEAPVYQLKLYNQDENLLGGGKIDFTKKKKIKDTTVEGDRVIGYHKDTGVIRLKKYYNPKNNEKFRIEISGKGDYDLALFCVSYGEFIDSYPGKLTINGKEKKGDLRINVQQLYKGNLIGKSKYLLVCSAIISLEMIIYALVFYKGKRKGKL